MNLNHRPGRWLFFVWLAQKQETCVSDRGSPEKILEIAAILRK